MLWEPRGPGTQGQESLNPVSDIPKETWWLSPPTTP